MPPAHDNPEFGPRGESVNLQVPVDVNDEDQIQSNLTRQSQMDQTTDAVAVISAMAGAGAM